MPVTPNSVPGTKLTKLRSQKDFLRVDRTGFIGGEYKTHIVSYLFYLFCEIGSDTITNKTEKGIYLTNIIEMLVSVLIKAATHLIPF